MTEALEVEQQEIQDREESARNNALQIISTEEEYFPYADYEVVGDSGVRYLVEIRSLEQKKNSCSCPDFHVNTLGTCKHIEGVLRFIQKRKLKTKNSLRTEIFVNIPLSQIEVQYPEQGRESGKFFVMPYFSSEGIWEEDSLESFTVFQEELEEASEETQSEVRLSSYLKKWIEEQTFKSRCKQDEELFLNEIREGKRSLQMLSCQLFPYQQEGMLHLAFKGRAILADEMGLGKTIQAIAACELLRRMGRVQRVLVLSPASLKGEWEEQIARFIGLPTLLVRGNRKCRLESYQKDSFFYLMNYEQIRNDIPEILSIMRPDVLILDEAQRIKNWRTKTATSVKRLKTPYAFVLTGTPIENRIEELYSLMQVVEPKILGPLFKFRQDFFEVDASEKATGYKNLQMLHSKVEPVLLRRRKKEVEEHLPERTMKNYFLPMTLEQKARYEDYEGLASRLAKLAQRRPLTHEEFKKLQQYLACMRMLADTPYILDENCRDCPKLQELEEILKGCFEEENSDTKVIIFSEWERMLFLVKELADRLGVEYAWHTGSVPQDKRRLDIKRFKEDKTCRLFLTTDAGSTGLNLQVANIVINLDLPWNPAKLEQRIARAWRKMQTKHVQVINLITENCIEHKMLGTLAFKQAVADAVIDALEGVDELPLSKEQWLKQLEALTGEEESSPAEEPLTVESFQSILLSRFQDRIHLIQQQGEALLVVVDTKDASLEEGMPTFSHPIEILDLQTYLLLQRLALQGLIQLEDASKKHLFMSDLLQNTQKGQKEHKLDKARKVYTEAKRKMQMAHLLQTGGFLEEASNAAIQSIEIAEKIISDLQLRVPKLVDSSDSLADGIAKRSWWLEELSYSIQEPTQELDIVRF